MSDQTLKMPSFTFSAEPIADTAPPEAPVSKALATVMAAPPAQRDSMEYAKHLSGQDRNKAMKEAVGLFNAAVVDQTVTMDYGNDALAGLNDLVKKMLNEVDPVSIPELKQLLSGFQREMASIKGKYDLNDPKVKKSYENWLSGTKSFFNKAKDFLAMFKADIQSIERQIDQIERDLAVRRGETLKNVVLYDQIYAHNELAIQKLMYKLAVMELFVQYGEQQLRRPPTVGADGAPLSDHEISEWKQARVDQVMVMRTKIANFKGRLGIGWATSPQARMSRMSDVALAAQLDNLVNTAIPLARLTLLMWRQGMKDFENAQTAETVGTMVNNMAQGYATFHADTVAYVAKIASQPIFWPETIDVVTSSLQTAATGLLAGYDAGEQKHREIEAALQRQQVVLSDTSKMVEEGVLARAVGDATKPLPAELTTVRTLALPASPER